MKTRNPIARDLRTPKYRKRVVKDVTRYSRTGNCIDLDWDEDDQFNWNWGGDYKVVSRDPKGPPKKE